MLSLAIILASMSPNTTRSADNTASSSSVRQLAIWQASVERKSRCLQSDMGNSHGFFIRYATGDIKVQREKGEMCDKVLAFIILGVYNIIS